MKKQNMENQENLITYIENQKNNLAIKYINKLIRITKLRYNEGQIIKYKENNKTRTKKIEYYSNDVENIFNALKNKYNDKLIKNKKIENINLYLNKIKLQEEQNLINNNKSELTRIKKALKRLNKKGELSKKQRLNYNKLKEEEKKYKNKLEENYSKRQIINKNIRVINWEKKGYNKNDLINIIEKKQREEEEQMQQEHILKARDNFRGFKMFNYQLSGVKTLRNFYETIKNLDPEKKRHRYTYVLTFFNNDKKEKRFITVKPKNILNYDTFINYIDRLNRGEVKDSDVLNIEKYELDFNYIQIKRLATEAEGNAKFNFCEVEEVKGENKKCLKNCLNKYFKYDNDIKDIEEAKTICEKNNYKLIIYADYPDTKLEFLETDEYYEGENDIYKKVEYKTLKILNQNCSKSKKVIELVYKNKHVAIFKNILNNLYICPNLKLYNFEDNKMKLKSKRTEIYTSNPEINKDKQYEINYVVFDLETIFNIEKKLMLEPYSLSYVIGSNKNNIFETGFYYGVDCVKEFIKKLHAEQEKKLYVLIGYNSSNFDNYFLIEEMSNLDWLYSIFHSNNSILNLKFGGPNRHTCFDLNKFTLSSLKKACENYKTYYKKIADFNHFEIQKYFNDNNDINKFFHEKECNLNKCFINWKSTFKNEKTKYGIGHDYHFNNNMPCKCEKFKNLVKYNVYDVLSTLELYLMLEKILKNINALNGREFFDYKTIGSFIFNDFTRDIELYDAKTKKIKDEELENKILMPLLPLDLYKNVRCGLFAGRTQCFHGVKYDMSGDKNYFMIDVKSLYPYVMLNRYYPCGKILKLSFEECNKKKLIGFYMCKFNQINLKKNILPLRGDVLDWNYKGEQTLFLNTIDINMLIKYNCHVEIIESENNFCFSHKVNGNELFKCTKKWKLIKEKQDYYKSVISKYEKNNKCDIDEKYYEKCKKEYNPALRGTAKIFLNSLSGKVIENIHITKTKLVRNQKEYNEIINNNEMDKIELIQKFDENKGIIQYEIDEETALKESNKPLYLGVLIYSYARSYMYNSVIHGYDVIYMDTDSALLIESEYKRMLMEKPKLFGSKFGQYELEEFHEKYNARKIIILAPKNYFILDENNTILKKGFKGINLNNDIILNKCDLDKYFIHLSKRDKKPYYDINDNDKLNFDLYNFILYDQKLNNKDNIINFVEQIKNNGFAYVLCSKLLKVKKTMKNKQGGAIYQRFEIKKIDIRENKKEFKKKNKKYIE